MKAAPTAAATKISRRIFTFVTKAGLPTTDQRELLVPMEKNLHGRSPSNRNRGYCFEGALKKMENTSVRTIIISKGLSRDQTKPKAEWRYLSFRSLLMMFQRMNRVDVMLCCLLGAQVGFVVNRLSEDFIM